MFLKLWRAHDYYTGVCLSRFHYFWNFCTKKGEKRERGGEHEQRGSFDDALLQLDCLLKVLVQKCQRGRL